MRTLLNNGMSIFTLMVVLPFLLCGCATKELLIEKTIFSGGDEEPLSSFNNGSVKDLSANETVAFFRAKGSEKHFDSAATNQTVIEIGRPIDYVGGVDFTGSKNTALSVHKMVSQGEYASNSIDIDLSSYKKENPIYYIFTITNIGTTPVHEFTLVDALPKEFIAESVDIVTAPFLRYENIDDLIWDIKEKEGGNYLIIRSKMNKEPLGGTTKKLASMQIRVTGKLNYKRVVTN